jgi:ABC-type sugar transport system ATPase subunit
MMSTPEPQAPIVLSLQGVSKRFGAVQALRAVSVDCRAGEIHAVVGENGSGKSTLLGIASGYLAPDEGSVRIAQNELLAAHAAEARRSGLGMAYQTCSHVLDLSVAENLFLAAPPEERPLLAGVDAWAVGKLEEFDLYVRPSARMSGLSLSLRQFLEVVKALLSKPKVLLLDEPTTALGPGEVERLHELVLAQAARGVGVVYVSHRLPEVLGIAHRVTVLRDGESQGTFDAAKMSEKRLVALMIGRPLELAFPERNGSRNAEDALLRISGFKGRRFGPLDLDVRSGEILGIAGAAGNGQEELLKCLAGVEPAAGRVQCNGADVDLRSPYTALRSGILLLSGDRVGESLFPVLGVRTNSTIQVLRRFSRGGWLHRRKESDAVDALVRRLKIRTPSVDQPIRFLSGGNQQKVVLTRPFLRGDVHVLIADEPTQGVDVRSRFDIYAALRSKADEGVAMILKSSDPLELAGLCDRVIVISRGRIVDEILGAELSEKRIIEAIVGSKVLAPLVAAEEAR